MESFLFFGQFWTCSSSDVTPFAGASTSATPTGIFPHTGILPVGGSSLSSSGTTTTFSGFSSHSGGDGPVRFLPPVNRKTDGLGTPAQTGNPDRRSVMTHTGYPYGPSMSGQGARVNRYTDGLGIPAETGNLDRRSVVAHTSYPYDPSMFGQGTRATVPQLNARCYRCYGCSIQSHGLSTYG